MAITSAQVHHAGRFLRQHISKIKVGIIGGYHGVNLGDIALGTAVLKLLTAKGINSGMQTIYNLEKWKWPKAPFAIVGGGAIGYSDSLIRVARRYKGAYSNVGLLGVDFNEASYSGEVLQLMKEAGWVSCRSEKQANRINEITNRKDVIFHPDLAFSLLPQYCAVQRKQNTKQKKLLVNIVPLYSKIQNGSFISSQQYAAERPELYQSFDLMQETYKKFLRNQVIKALDEGYAVETIPFTPADAEASQIVLQGLSVTHSPYYFDPIKMIKRMANAEHIIATRYHATIFALKLGAVLTPIAYAVKNELLLQELGVQRNQFLSSEDFVNGNTDIPSPVRVASDVIERWETLSTNAINQCITSLGIA